MPLSASMQNVSNDILRCPVSADNNDGYDLRRFVVAQANTYQRACEELRQGRKRSHWIWFIFPQMKGLGVSVTSQVYGIDSLAEARAYLTHPVLGPRLIEATRLMLSLRGSLHDILGSPDDMKFRSSMTLFASAASAGSVFDEALTAFCGSEPDSETLALISEG